MRILVTGGAGYIGSHACVSLLQAGHEVTVIDNLCNSSSAALSRVQQLSGKPLKFVKGDVRNPGDLDEAFSGGVDAVMHFAALKAVGESCENPLLYFENNISGTISLLRAMDRAGVSVLVFSSSATVYGSPDRTPVNEEAPLRTTNPYGRSKLVMENLIQDWCSANKRISAVLLRYFNPVGAHPSGLIGEDPRGEPANLMPYIAQVAAGQRSHLKVFGSDYPTTDGTGVRDYIHVVDLAEAHVAALAVAASASGSVAYNLGVGRGYSVLEVVEEFKRVTGREVPLEIVARRPGDVAELVADPSKAREDRKFAWKATRGLAEMCADVWRWQCQHPRGFLD